MKKLLIIAALGLPLAACGGGSSLQVPTALTPTAINADIAAVQSTAAGLCGFLPAASTVANIIATFTGGGGIVNVVSQTAQAICNAVPALHAARLRPGSHGATVVRVRGVRLQGSFLQK